ncbi:MAG: DUF1800 domain-containing protein [Planctomycetota bacterium]
MASSIPPSLSRRQVVAGGAAAAAIAATSANATAQGLAYTGGATRVAPLARLRRTSLAVTLLQRASFGHTESDLAEVETRGLHGWLDWQLEPNLIDDSSLNNRLASFDWLNWSAQQMEDHPTLEGWEIAHELRAVRLLRATYSKRQLFERIVEFWTDHFNIYGTADGVDVLKAAEDRDVIRTHALGKFRDMLHASAKSAAMIAYLDNDNNEVGAPNENYSREVMELHTLGVNGPYNEEDVRELARCFTGWSYWKSWQTNTQYGEFRFRSSNHDTGPKTVLGINVPANGGVEDAEMILDHLASHPSTIDHVTRKLARWLIGYDPEPRVIARAKSVWTNTDGDIKEVVRILLQPGFLLHTTPKLKRPFHWIVSLFRATQVDLNQPMDTIWQIWGLGQVPYQWPAPNGYPDSAEAWGSGMQPRWVQSSQFGNGWYWSTGHTINDWPALLAGAPKSGWAARLNEIFCGGGMSVEDEDLLQGYLDTFNNPTNVAIGEAFELAASCPSFMYY